MRSTALVRACTWRCSDRFHAVPPTNSSSTNAAAEGQDGRVAIQPRAANRAAQVLLDEAIELAGVLQPIERDAQRRDDVLAPRQHREVIRPRDQRHFDRVLRQRSHQEAHRQVIAGDAVDLAALERADLRRSRVAHDRQRRPARFRQRRRAAGD